MDFKKKMQEPICQGLAASRELFDKAKVKTKELGDIGILKLEIRQLSLQAEKLATQLGIRVYEILGEREQETISRRTPGIRDTMDEIDRLKERIRMKEDDLKNRESNRGQS